MTKKKCVKNKFNHIQWKHTFFFHASLKTFSQSTVATLIPFIFVNDTNP